MTPNRTPVAGNVETTMRDLGARLAKVRLSRNLIRANESYKYEVCPPVDRIRLLKTKAAF